MALLLVAAAIGHGGNHKRNNHTNHRQNLKISHDFFPLSPLLRASEGKAKSQAPSVALHAMELFSSPMALFYHGGIFLSIVSGDFTVCLFGWKTQRFARGSTLGLKCGSHTAAAPDCAKEPNVEAALRPLWTLFIGFAAKYLLPTSQ